MYARRIGQTLRVCQLNVEGISKAKCEYLSRLLAEENIDVAMFQETHTVSPEALQSRGSINNFIMAVSVDSSVHGIATYIRSNLTDVSILETTNSDSIYSSSIRVGSLNVINVYVYKAPSSIWSDAVLKTFPHPAIYAGDFNSHHSEWGYNNIDNNGELVVDWAVNNELHLVFDPKDKCTFFSAAHQRGYNPDLCFVSTDAEGLPLQITRKVLPRFPRSQHRPVIYEIGLLIPIVNSVPRPRWNFRKANWSHFKTELDAAVRFIPPVARNYDRFNKLVIETAKKCIPRGYRKEYIPCWNEDSDRLYEEFKESEDPETAKELLKSLNEARRSRWIETVEKMDMKRSSRKGWALIRKLGGATKLKRLTSTVTPNQIAQHIVQTSSR